MLALFAAAPKAHQSWGDFAASLGDRLFDDAQYFIINVLPKLVIIFVLAWILTRILTVFTERMVRVAERHSGGSGHVSQARTLSSVVKATGLGIIGFLAVLQVLPMLGFNLAPLLTSAGVAGVAIGLAAQTIVKDCLNGMLILLEDQYNVGDWIKIAGFTGQVEAMTLRKTSLRDGDGTLYIIPNSQITSVANLTRNYSAPVLSVALDYGADPDKVIALLTEVSMSVRNDPKFKDAFLSDPSVLGVDAVKGSQIIYPIALKTGANQQWGPLRELQRRIRLALVEHDLLPGDPYRVFHYDQPATQAPSSGELHHEPNSHHPDPTAARPIEVNPFTGEGA